VQIVWFWRRRSPSIERFGSAHDEVELAALKTAAVARLAAGQTELDLGRDLHRHAASAAIQLLWHVISESVHICVTFASVVSEVRQVVRTHLYTSSHHASSLKVASSD
jgi:hypothetical protein